MSALVIPENVAGDEDALWGWLLTYLRDLSVQMDTSHPRWHQRKKPVYGGCFGHGGFALTSVPISSAGLDDVSYCVRHESGCVLMVAGTRTGALRQARRILESVSPVRLQLVFDQVAQAIAAREQGERRKAQEEWRARKAAPRASIKSIPRRRRQIFEASGGKCHYCETVLTLDGKWHIEHKMPKALGGGNEPGNLVASCAPCNHKKRDQTDVEFKAQRAGRAS